ncbi:hypothetical protein PRIC1_010267 [Phytophthora ramorum]
MKEFSLESLKNDTEDVVGRVKDTLFGSGSDDGSGNSNRKEKPEPTTRTPSMPTKSTTDDSGSTETDSKTTKAPRSTTQKTTDEKSEKSGTKTHSGSTGDSYNWDYFEGSGVTTPAPDSTTASPFTILPAAPTVPPTPTPAATANSSAYESTQQISTSNSSTSLPGGAIAGVVVGAACVMFMIAAFVTMKKRAASQRFSLSKLPSVFGESRAVPLATSRLAPPGAFGKLNSGRSEMDDPNMSGIFTISRDDPFTRRHMRKGGIWDDPLLVAARIPLEKIRIQELIARGGGRKPTEAAILQMVAVGTLQVEFSRDCPLELLTLAHACISVDPKDRPTAADALYKLHLVLKTYEEQEVTL